jgi:hypothetical protein
MTDRLDGMSETDRMEAVDQLAHEAMLAIDAEPENMELNFAVARFYRGAGEFEQDLMTQARYHTDKGIQSRASYGVGCTCPGASDGCRGLTHPGCLTLPGHVAIIHPRTPHFQ